MKRKEPATAVGVDPKETDVGSVFVSNYPPYSFWDANLVDRLLARTGEPPEPDTPLGLYLHVPFCRRRCKFCYFRVFTDKSGDDVKRYMSALGHEIAMWSERPIVGGRPVRFVYFGGGTPSFINTHQMRALARRLRSAFDLSSLEEFTFECEPGTLTQAKLEAIREIGVTRLSLGVENFDDRILQENGRAHVSKEIYRVAPWIRELDFDQLNIDLIAGMVGETWDTWKVSVQKTLEMDPDSVTIYQMELPFNTVYSRSILDGGPVPVADWETKRAWHAWAFERLAEAGYERSSAYTMVRRGKPCRFVYRDSVWRGCDLLSMGVSSFGHLAGLHYQNASGWTPYLETVEGGSLPVDRGFSPDDRERLTRELILQLKLGQIRMDYFEAKYGENPATVFEAPLRRLEQRGMLVLEPGRVRLTDDGLLRVDSLLPEFYADRYQNSRYT